MNNDVEGATRYFYIESPTPYKPIHIPSSEDTPENIDYCANCTLPDCKYDTLEQCKLNDRKPKHAYGQAKADNWPYSYWKHDA